MNLGLANWKIKYKHTWLFYRHHCLAHFNMVLALLIYYRYTEVVLWSLQYGGQVKGGHSALCSGGLDIWTPVLAAPFHQVWSDGKSICARRSSPLQASRAGCHIGPWNLGTSGVSPSITLDSPATFSATMRRNISWPSVTWDWSHDFLLLWTRSIGIHVDL